jgi:putative FmdB family regulatory protein
MPIYEYQCQSCEDIIEKCQSLSDAPLTTCPSCAGSLKKLISMSSFQLKGSGWYADGYSSASSCAKSSSSYKTPSSTPSSSDSTPASDSKPACADKKACCGC